MFAVALSCGECPLRGVSALDRETRVNRANRFIQRLLHLRYRDRLRPGRASGGYRDDGHEYKKSRKHGQERSGDRDAGKASSVSDTPPSSDRVGANLWLRVRLGTRSVAP